MKRGDFFFGVFIAYFFSEDRLEEQFLSQEVFPQLLQTWVVVDALSVALQDFLLQQFFTISQDVIKTKAIIMIMITDTLGVTFVILH